MEVFLYHLMRVVLLMGNSVNEVDSMRMDVFNTRALRELYSESTWFHSESTWFHLDFVCALQ